MSTTNTTHDSSSTAWLGELAAEMTEKQLGQLNHLRRELAPQGATEDDRRHVDASLLGDAYEEVEHNRLQQRLAHIPLPDWAPDAADGWMLDNDGATRRGHTLLSFPDIHCTVPSARAGAYVSVYAGGEEVAGSAPEFFVNIEAHGAALDAEQARQFAAQILEAADKREEVQAEATVPA